MIFSSNWAKIKLLAATFTATATLTACSTGVSNPLDSLTGDYKYAPDFIKANIITGKSTKEEIRQKFGAPYSVDEDVADNESTWNYDRSKSSFNTLADMAYKYSSRYGSGEASSQILDGQVQASKAQEAMEDVQTVSGMKSPNQISNIRQIYITFKGDVVRNYRTY